MLIRPLTRIGCRNWGERVVRVLPSRAFAAGIAFGICAVIGVAFSVSSASASPDGVGQPSSRGYTVSEFTSLLDLDRITDEKLRFGTSRIAVRRFETPLGTVLLRTPRDFDPVSALRLERAVKRAWAVAALSASRLGLPGFSGYGEGNGLGEMMRLTSTSTEGEQSSEFGGPLAALMGPLGVPDPLQSVMPPLTGLTDWNVVLSANRTSFARGGASDKAYCHTAWIGPPADIVVDGYRLLHPCDGSLSGPESENRLVRTLVHEVGHAIEFHLMGRGFSRRQRWHSEGFAVWFETASLDLLGSGARTAAETVSIRERAQDALRTAWSPALFSGTPADYFRSFGLVQTVVDRAGIDGLVRVYNRMNVSHRTFEESVHDELGWGMSDWRSFATRLASTES